MCFDFLLCWIYIISSRWYCRINDAEGHHSRHEKPSDVFLNHFANGFCDQDLPSDGVRNQLWIFPNGDISHTEKCVVYLSLNEGYFVLPEHHSRLHIHDIIHDISPIRRIYLHSLPNKLLRKSDFLDTTNSAGSNGFLDNKRTHFLRLLDCWTNVLHIQNDSTICVASKIVPEIRIQFFPEPNHDDQHKCILSLHDVWQQASRYHWSFWSLAVLYILHTTWCDGCCVLLRTQERRHSLILLLDIHIEDRRRRRIVHLADLWQFNLPIESLNFNQKRKQKAQHKINPMIYLNPFFASNNV